MPRASKSEIQIKETLSQERVASAIQDLTKYIQSNFDFKSGNVVLIGLRTRGYILAQRIADVLNKNLSCDIDLGAIDITLYRDDVHNALVQPIVKETEIDFPIDNKTVVLIDDVLFTGRSVRAALDEIMDFGRPKSIHLMVLIDRGHRELPIAAEYAALKIQTTPKESVNLNLREVDSEENILITEGRR